MIPIKSNNNILILKQHPLITISNQLTNHNQPTNCTNPDQNNLKTNKSSNINKNNQYAKCRIIQNSMQSRIKKTSYRCSTSNEKKKKTSDQNIDPATLHESIDNHINRLKKEAELLDNEQVTTMGRFRKSSTMQSRINTQLVIKNTQIINKKNNTRLKFNLQRLSKGRPQLYEMVRRRKMKIAMIEDDSTRLLKNTLNLQIRCHHSLSSAPLIVNKIHQHSRMYEQRIKDNLKKNKVSSIKNRKQQKKSNKQQQ